MRKLVYECIDDILTEVIMNNVFKYVTVPYLFKDNKCLDMYIYIYIYIYIYHSNNYYDTFADNISIDRLKN